MAGLFYILFSIESDSFYYRGNLCRICLYV